MRRARPSPPGAPAPGRFTSPRDRPQRPQNPRDLGSLHVLDGCAHIPLSGHTPILPTAVPLTYGEAIGRLWGTKCRTHRTAPGSTPRAVLFVTVPFAGLGVDSTSVAVPGRVRKGHRGTATGPRPFSRAGADAFGHDRACVARWHTAAVGNADVHAVHDAAIEQPVCDVRELDESSIAVVGGKGAHLGELSRIDGVLVPGGFCVTTYAFRRVMESAPSIDNQLGQLSRLNLD